MVVHFNPSPLVEKLSLTLGRKKQGLWHSDYPCQTPLDLLFSRLAASYNTFDNKFLRAELAEKILIECLENESSDFKSGSTMGRGGHGVVRWGQVESCFDQIQGSEQE